MYDPAGVPRKRPLAHGADPLNNPALESLDILLQIIKSFRIIRFIINFLSLDLLTLTKSGRSFRAIYLKPNILYRSDQSEMVSLIDKTELIFIVPS